MKQILPDSDFKRGFTVLSQKEHDNNERVTRLGDFTYGAADGDPAPVWKLAQWDSGPCMWKNRAESDKYTLTDGTSRSVVYNPSEASLTMRIDTAAYYNGRAAVIGDYWPHLLIEQGFPAVSVEDTLKVDLDLRLLDYSETPISGDYVRAAQFLMFLYLKGRENGEFVWFGLHFFDSRSAFSDTYIGYDVGKADASKALIYSVGEKGIFGEQSLWKDGAPCANGEWRHLSIDMMPHLEALIAYGKKDNYFTAVKKPSDFTVCGLNIGWESIATFDHTMETKNLKIFA